MTNTTTKKHRFDPDYLVPPGDTLKESLEEAGMTQSDLAERIGLSEKTVSQIVNGVAPISYDTSDRLELVLGIPASFWNHRELAYREALTRQEETAKLEADKEWLKELPIKELIQRGIIQAATDQAVLVRHALRFFGVSSVNAWRRILLSKKIAYRGGETSEKKPGYVAAWRRLGVLEAQKLRTEPFDASEFRQALKTIRNSMLGKDLVQLIVNECAKAGVAVVFVPEFKGGAISGLTRWLSPDKAMIQLSLKGKRDDQLWFTFFHEAGHILLHSKKNVFVDLKINDSSPEEKQANQFARDVLIPPQYANRLYLLKSKDSVRAFAKELGLPPGIVVGRLQHQKLILPSAMNDLKRKLQWV